MTVQSPQSSSSVPHVAAAGSGRHRAGRGVLGVLLAPVVLLAVPVVLLAALLFPGQARGLADAENAD